jgi:hypothetical protein
MRFIIASSKENTVVGQKICGISRMIGPCTASVGTLSVNKFSATCGIWFSQHKLGYEEIL